MNTLFKILVILIVAIVVGGMFYGIVNITSSGLDQSSIAERPTGEEFSADGELARPERIDDVGGILFPVEMIKNLAIISIVSLIYLNTSRLFGRKRSVLQATQ